ncbi:MAG: FAD-dependent oxidoreductase [Gammaproteobacteria bacterium]|nr:FAD-dependent oxidoreductase [Gammaproteobacteria bacterium]
MIGTSKSDCVIVGAGHAGAQLATRLRRLGWQGAITLVGEEAHLPYHRPPLSKDYMKGVKSLGNVLLNPEVAYRNADIDLLLGEQVRNIDRDSCHVTLASGKDLRYDKLALATGSRPRQLPVPGADTDGVFYLRNVDDVDRIRNAVVAGGNAVVIGGGYIGLEAAASLRTLGMNVTVVEAMERVLQRVTCECVSSFFARVHAEEGVEIRTGTAVSGIRGKSKVSGVETGGGEQIPADLVVVGIGIVPNVELAENAGLETDNGIAVNQFAQTSDRDIYAVGDCTSFVHPRYQRRIRLESVQNANDQAVTAARSICGQNEPYDALPWFWSDQYDVKLQIAGLAEGAAEIVVRGDTGSGRSASVLYLKDDRLLAVDAMNNPRDFVFGKKLITENARLDPAVLADSDSPLNAAIID